MTDDELRGWIDHGPSHPVRINSRTLTAICEAALAARADHAAALIRERDANAAAMLHQRQAGGGE